MFASVFSIIVFASVAVTLLQRLETRIFRPDQRASSLNAGRERCPSRPRLPSRSRCAADSRARGPAARGRQDVRRLPGARGHRPRFPARRADDPARALGLRQDHHAQDHRRPARADRGRGPGQRPTGHRPGPGARLRLPGLRAPALGDVLRNVAFGLELRHVPKEEREEIARKHIAEVGLVGRRAQVSARAVRRHAPARRPRPRARGRRRDPAHGRAVRLGRRAEPAQVPGGPPAPARAREEDGDLRHPLDRGGGLHLRPGRRADPQSGPPLARRAAGDRPLRRISTISGARRPISTASTRSGTSSKAISRTRSARHDHLRLPAADLARARASGRCSGRSSGGST